jgi:hypothetical protein
VAQQYQCDRHPRHWAPFLCPQSSIMTMTGAQHVEHTE